MCASPRLLGPAGVGERMRGRKTENIQSTTCKHTNQHGLDAAVDVELPQVRYRHKQEQEIVKDVEAGQKVVQHGAVDAAAGQIGVPVLGDGPAGEDAGAQTDEAVGDKPDHDAHRNLAGQLGLEDAPVLEEDGELDHHLGEAVGYHRGVEGD